MPPPMILCIITPIPLNKSKIRAKPPKVISPGKPGKGKGKTKNSSITQKIHSTNSIIYHQGRNSRMNLYAPKAIITIKRTATGISQGHASKNSSIDITQLLYLHQLKEPQKPYQGQ